jgi:hypothetical protein
VLAATTPECAGNTVQQAEILGAALVSTGNPYAQAVGGAVLIGAPILRNMGIKVGDYQSYANCVPICVSFPSSKHVVSEDIYWTVDGSLPNTNGTAYYKTAYDLWGPGPGWHRIDAQAIEKPIDANNTLYCHNFRNWSDNQTRAATQCVNVQ